MNILYYIPHISQQMGGIRQYAVALLKLLARDKENNYFVFHESNDPEVLATLHHHPHLKLVKRSDVPVSRYISKLNRVLNKKEAADQAFLNIICRKRDIRVIHTPYQYLPVVKGVRTVCTMHDVQEIHFPQYFSAQDRALRAVKYLEYITNADLIFVSYAHVKKDLIRFFGVNEDKIVVCLLEMENLWFDKFTDKDMLLPAAMGVPDRYILLPANTWEHKNHIRLLEALVILRQQGTVIHIVCTGHQTDYFTNVLEPFIQENGLSNQLTFAGIVDEQTLYSLYMKSVGIAVPTLYEAGSFPLMEAILLGIPVICSNVTSLPETINNQAYVFDPLDAAAIAKKLDLLWTDENYRKEAVANTIIQSHRLRNTGALNIIKAAYRSINID